MAQLGTCLWFDQQGDDAAKFYTNLFPSSRITRSGKYGSQTAPVIGRTPGTTMAVEFNIANAIVMALNGGPIFKATPGLSFFVTCTDEAEINSLWKSLSEGGTVRMRLDKYPWADRYGWTSDRFGVEWQLILTPNSTGEKIASSFLFVDELFGRGEEAIKHYMSIFPNSKIQAISHDEKTKTVMHGAFTLNGQDFKLMEGPGTHSWKFNEATSIVVFCDTQDEIDYYWSKLLAGGSESQCGWLKDKYGVSWQIVPSFMGALMADEKNVDKIMQVVFPMKKIDMKKILQAVG